MSFITHSGYGYSEELCEDVTSWFLNNFFPRHKIEVQIEHRDLKEEYVRGYCDVASWADPYRPRDFLIELDTYMTKELYIQTLLHELTHLAQWIRGSSAPSLWKIVLLQNTSRKLGLLASTTRS